MLRHFRKIMKPIIYINSETRQSTPEFIYLFFATDEI